MTIYKHDFTDHRNILSNPLASLKELGVRGGKRDDPIKENLYYTFPVRRLPQVIIHFEIGWHCFLT